MYQYIHEDDENTFQLVDTSRLPKPAYQRRPRYQQNVREIPARNRLFEWFFFVLAISTTTEPEQSLWFDAKIVCRSAEKIENDEEFRNVNTHCFNR